MIATRLAPRPSLGAASQLAAVRASLNARASAFAARSVDVDADGRVFRAVLIVLLTLSALRIAYEASTGLPVFEQDVPRNLAVGVALLPLVWAAARFRMAEASLLLRAGAILGLCGPLLQTLCIDVFFTGRRFPLADATFAAMDRALGLDWIAYARFLDAHASLWDVTAFAYNSILFQFGAVVAVMAFSRAASKLYAYLVAQTLSLTIVASVALFLPAIGAYEQYGAAHAQMVHTFITADSMTSSIRWLRDGASGPGGVTMFTLISFPSFHVCCAVLFTWSVWHVPYLRWASLVLNLSMAAATPVHGSHYFVDVIAGAIIAPVAIVLAKTFVGRLTARGVNPGPRED